MKIFITGGSGLLGQYLNIELSKHHQILTQYYSNPGNCLEYNSLQFSIVDFNLLEKVFKDFSPDFVIHTAAISNPEMADELPADSVYKINVNATKRIAELCVLNKAKLFYLSTDLVYAGYRGSFLKEEAKLVPISLYAETKLMGEVKIRETCNDYLILRESLLIGFGFNNSRNNFHKMYENLKEGKPVKLLTDQYRTPLSLQDSARIISELIEKNISSEIINLGGCNRVSRYELGEIFCEESGFDKKLLVKTTMEEAGLTYKVEDVSLNIDKLKSFGIEPTVLRQSIRNIISSQT
jgi:dTDP-4-dehydrorhamnose reductase